MDVKKVKASTHPGKLAYWLKKTFEEQPELKSIKLRCIGAGSTWQAMKAVATDEFTCKPAFGETETFEGGQERTTFYVEVIRPQ